MYLPCSSLMLCCFEYSIPVMVYTVCGESSVSITIFYSGPAREVANQVYEKRFARLLLACKVFANCASTLARPYCNLGQRLERLLMVQSTLLGVLFIVFAVIVHIYQIDIYNKLLTTLKFDVYLFAILLTFSHVLGFNLLNQVVTLKKMTRWEF